MNLHFKPILWLVGGIVVTFALSLCIQLYRNTTVAATAGGRKHRAD